MWGSSKRSKGRRVRSWEWPQHRQGQCPHWLGTQPQVPKQEKKSRSGDRNQGQPQSTISREVPRWRGRLRFSQEGKSAGQAQRGTWQGTGWAAAQLKRQNAKAQLTCCSWAGRRNMGDETSHGSIPQPSHSCFYSNLIQGCSSTTAGPALKPGLSSGWVCRALTWARCLGVTKHQSTVFCREKKKKGVFFYWTVCGNYEETKWYWKSDVWSQHQEQSWCPDLLCNAWFWNIRGLWKLRVQCSSFTSYLEFS